MVIQAMRKLALPGAFLLLMLTNPIIGQDAVDLGMTCRNQHDTVWVGYPTSLDVYIANTYALGGIQLGFEFWSPDHALWEWLAQPNGYGPITHCVTVVPFSRLDPNGDGNPDDVFDITGLVVTEQNVSESGRDSMLAGGYSGNLQTGPLQHMYSHHLMVDVIDSSSVFLFCMDSCYVPPFGEFVFINAIGQAAPPTCLWSAGGRCWPVKALVCGDANRDGDANLGDAIFLITHIFSGGHLPNPACVGDANGDGSLDVGDIVFLIAHVFYGGPPPVEDCCS